MENFTIALDDQGIATVTFDVPGRSMNTLTSSVIADLPQLIAQLRSDDAIKGVLIRSGKASGFCAGADLGDLAPLAGTRIDLPPLSALFRELELLGKPVAAALEGTALGGGLELALACHYRVAADTPKLKLGLPEANVGLLPGAGGTQRLPRLIGAANALPLMLEGRLIDAAAAKGLGFIDEVVPAADVVEAARRWLLGNPSAVARWDAKGFRVPGGLPYTPGGMQTFVVGNAMLRKKTFGNYPAAENIMKCVFEGLQVGIDQGLRIEGRYFRGTFATPQARAMIRTLFLSKQALAKGGSWGGKARPPERVGVIGAGMMGAGIAHAQAARGIDTVLIDVDQAAADRGKEHARTLVSKAVGKGRLSAGKGEELLARIKPSADYDDLVGAGLVVEAVFENIDLKHDIVRRVEQRLGADAVLGSNTSTLPISLLAEASVRPANFIGIHFFSPVDRMELVEVIRGKETSDDTVARAVAYALAIGKTPIVVNDSRGFYTSRCFGTYINEALEMLMEGVSPALIENAGRMTGMPRAPLEMADDVAVDLVARVIEQTRAALGAAHDARPFEPLVESMVAQGRAGRKANAGFYDYPEGAPKRLWPGLREAAKVTAEQLPPVDLIKRRLLHRQALEAARCFDEGVITDPRAADVGAILGWGFAPWSGGPLSYIGDLGTARFVAECDDLAAQYGKRFAVPEGLRRMAQTGATYYDTNEKAAA